MDTKIANRHSSNGYAVFNRETGYLAYFAQTRDAAREWKGLQNEPNDYTGARKVKVSLTLISD